MYFPYFEGCLKSEQFVYYVVPIKFYIDIISSAPFVSWSPLYVILKYILLYNLQRIIVNNFGYKKFTIVLSDFSKPTHFHQGKHLSQEGFDQGDLEKFQVVA